MSTSFTVSAVLALSTLAAASLRGQRPALQHLDTVRAHVASRVAPSLVSTQRSIEVISRESIDRQPARSVIGVLANAIGADVQMRSAAQADFALRGSSLGQVLVLVDGVRVNDLQTAHFDLDLAVPLELVDRIEILRGPGATLYGSDAVGGVVNIVTRRGESWHRVRAHAGSFGTAGAALGGSRPVGLRTELRAAADVERSSGHREGTDYEIAQVSAGVERALRAGRLSGDISIAARDFGAADFYAPAPSFERTRTQAASVRFSAPPAGAWVLAAAAAIRRHTDDFILRRSDPAFYRNQHSTLQRTLELGARRSVADLLGLAVGVEGFDAELASARLGNRREQRASAFGEATVGGAHGPNVNAGVRVDRSTRLGTFASPSLSASLPLHQRVRLRASAGRGLRAPSWTELYYVDPANVANPDITPERFWAAEVGARAAPDWGTLDAALFFRRANDLIDWVRPAGSGASIPWTTANLESATYRGAEVSLRVPDALGVDWALSATALRFNVEAAEGFDGKYALRPLTRVAAASISRQVAPGVRVTVEGREARRAGEARYLHVNARGSLQVRQATLLLDFLNLTNAAYLDASAKPVAGRGLVAGVRL